MGRPNTGVWNTCECIRLELSILLKLGLFKKGYRAETILTWSDKTGQITAKVKLTCSYGPDQYIRLEYETKGPKGILQNDYKIQFETIPSNLGKGEVIYLVCPKIQRRSRVLYMGYGLETFMCREAYQILYGRRIYYDLQNCSRRERFNTKYWIIEKQLSRLSAKKRTAYHLGKPTKRAVRMKLMKEEQWMLDELRWGPLAMTKSLARSLNLD